MYAHDGQNLFSTPEGGELCWGGWFLDAKLDYWWSVNDLPEFILVAVSSAELACACNRQKEYTVTEYSTAKHEPFVRYITEVVKVEVDTKFRTKPGREHTFTLGASLGGLFAFILSLSRSDVFSGCVCLSPAFWFVDRSNMSIYSMIPTRGDHDVPCQIYVWLLLLPASIQALVLYKLEVSAPLLHS